MARINTNVSSLTAQRGLARSQKQLGDTLRRLSSGLRINRGADDPAGLIASEGLRSEISGIGQAIDNSSRASNVIATAEGALGEVASLIRFTANAIADAVVPLVKVRTSTPSLPEISSVTELATELAVNWSSAVRALVTTLMSTGIMLAVPKLACATSRDLMSAVFTPLVM